MLQYIKLEEDFSTIEALISVMLCAHSSDGRPTSETMNYVLLDLFNKVKDLEKKIARGSDE